MEAKRILITGANGQLGSELQRFSTLFKNAELYFTDKDQLPLDEQGIIDKVKSMNPHIILHGAAYTAVDKAETDEEMAARINVGATSEIAFAAKECKALLIYISTDFVFDGSKSFPYDESDSVNPLSVYGITKEAGERMVKESGADYLIIRTSWVYSEYGNNFVKTIRKLCKEKTSLNIISDQIGTPTYAADLASFLIHICNLDRNEIVIGTYHFSNEGVASWYDFAIAIRDFSGMQTPIFPIQTNQYPTPATRPKYSVLNKSKLKKTFHYSIPYWRDSLKDCIDRLDQNGI